MTRPLVPCERCGKRIALHAKFIPGVDVQICDACFFRGDGEREVRRMRAHEARGKAVL